MSGGVYSPVGSRDSISNSAANSRLKSSLVMALVSHTLVSVSACRWLGAANSERTMAKGCEDFKLVLTLPVYSRQKTVDYLLFLYNLITYVWLCFASLRTVGNSNGLFLYFGQSVLIWTIAYI